jgi:hypothetical protein
VTAIRSVRAADGKFVQISNAALQDNRLSLSARGLIAFVLSLPPDKTFSAAWLETQVPDGRREIRSALRELQAAGYHRRTRSSKGGTWIWDQVISDAPVFTREDVEGEVPPSGAGPYDRNRPHAATCENTEPVEVAASDRIASDVNRPDKELNTNPKRRRSKNAVALRLPRVRNSKTTSSRLNDQLVADDAQHFSRHDSERTTDGTGARARRADTSAA